MENAGERRSPTFPKGHGVPSILRDLEGNFDCLLFLSLSLFPVIIVIKYAQKTEYMTKYTKFNFSWCSAPDRELIVVKCD